MNKSYCKYVYIIISVFILLQIIVLVFFGYTPYPDSDAYIRIAHHCVDMGESYPITSELPKLYFIWNVGAINAAALSLYMFHSVMPLMMVYTLMKGCTAFLIYKISDTLFHQKVAFTTLILYVIYPANYGEGTSLLVEVPFLFFILLGVLIAIKYQNKPLCIILGGSLMAIANWFRPLAIVFILSLCLYYIIVRYKDYLKSIYLVAGFLLMIGIIGSISYHRTGHFIYQARTGWQNLMQYTWDHDDHQEADKKLYAKGNPMYITDDSHKDVFQRDSIWHERCLTWISSHPTSYLKQIPAKVFYTYISDNVNLCALMTNKNSTYMYGEISMLSLKKDFPTYSYIQTLTVINLLYYYILIILFIISSIYMIKNKDKGVYMSLFIVCLGTMAISLVAHGEARFHNPYMPFIIMTAAYYVYQKIRTKR